MRRRLAARYACSSRRPITRMTGRHLARPCITRAADKVVAPVADTKDEAPGLATRIVLAAAAAGDAAGAAGGAAGGAPAVKKQKKRKPQFSPSPNEDPTTSQEETDDDMGNVVPPPPPPPAPLEGLRSPTEPFTLTELEDMHH